MGGRGSSSGKAGSDRSPYDAFMKMSDDQKASAILAAISQDIPNYLNRNSDFQKLIYNLGMNDKPTVVDDKTLDSMGGMEIYRTVNAVYDNNTGLSLTAPQIAKQTQSGEIVRVSHGSRGIYGDGIYFTSDKSWSESFGGAIGDVQETCVMRAKLNNNAKVITYRSADLGVYSEMRNNTSLGEALKKCKSTARVSVYALAKGYNVIDGENGNINVLNRKAITMSDSFSAI